MIINQANLTALFRGFKTSFNNGLTQAPSQYEQFVMRVPSQTKAEIYAWLGKFPGFREWVGDRVIQNLASHSYEVTNTPYENTIAVSRDDVEDDTYGVFSPMFEEMGRNTRAHPNELVFALLKEGFSKTAYDGQYFFDTDHPRMDASGNQVSVSNTGGGSGSPWFLMDLSRAIKPFIWQTRRPYDFQRLDAPTDQNVFMRKEMIYGVDARVAAAFGLWQLAYGSKQTLDKAAYKAGFEALEGMKGDYDRPLGIMPTHLVVGPSNREAGLEIINAERDSAGATNVWRGTTELVVVPWLA